MSKWTLLTSAMILGGCATTDWRTLRIDGSDATRFTESVAHLREELPRRRREYFDIALAVIFIDGAITASGGDINNDGNIDGNDTDAVLEVAIDAQRRDPATAIADSRELQGTYPAVDYLERLHGLGYEEVLALAGPSVVERYRALYQAYWGPRQARQLELARRARPTRPPTRPAGEPMRDPLGRVVN